MPKLLLTMLLSIAAFCVNAQTTFAVSGNTLSPDYERLSHSFIANSIATTDSTYKKTHDSLQATIVPDTIYNWYDSTYETPRRDSMYFDTTWTYCKVRGRSLLSFYWLFGGKATYRYCDTIKRPRKRYDDSLMTVNIINTSTQPKDTTSSFCCHIEYSSHIEYKLLPTTHDTTVKVEVIQPPTSIKWGLKIQNDNISNQINVAKQFPLASIRPNSIGVRDWNGNLGNVVDWHNADLFTVMNINWIDNPNEKPYDFVSGADTVKFTTNFETICIALKKAIYPNTPLFEKPKNDSLIIVIENEPANQKYYNWDSAAYIHELQMAITIAHKYGLKIADGCTHLEYIEMIRNGTWKQQDGAIRNKQILDAFKQKKVIPDYGDFHCAYEADRKSGAYPVPDLNTTISYYRDYTGLIAICNEYHMTGATASQVNGVWKSDQVDYFVSGYKAAGVPIVVAWSGDNVKSDAYNIGTTLTSIGLCYKEAIKQ